MEWVNVSVFLPISRYLRNGARLEQLFPVTFYIFVASGARDLKTMICLYVNQKAHVACILNCLIKTEGLLTVTGSQSHYVVIWCDIDITSVISLSL